MDIQVSVSDMEWDTGGDSSSTEDTESSVASMVSSSKDSDRRELSRHSRGMSVMGSSLRHQEHTCKKARVNRWDEPGDTSGTEPSNTSSRGGDKSKSAASSDKSLSNTSWSEEDEYKPFNELSDE